MDIVLQVVVAVCYEAICPHLCGGSEEKHSKPRQGLIVCLRAKITTLGIHTWRLIGINSHVSFGVKLVFKVTEKSKLLDFVTKFLLRYLELSTTQTATLILVN